MLVAKLVGEPPGLQPRFPTTCTLELPLNILWMDEILHHFETMGNHCLLVFTREASFQGVLGGEDFVHPQ